MKPTSSDGVQSERKFSKVLVKNFSTTVVDVAVQSKLEIAKKSFADHIASELTKTGRFSQVSRSGSADANTLIIDGVITQYTDGNSALRMMVGFGAGSSRFDANVNYREPRGATLGTVEVDKNSWALGGAIAASQDADSFMPGAAKKAAKEATKFAR